MKSSIEQLSSPIRSEMMTFAEKMEELFMFKEVVPFYHYELFGFGGLFAHAGDID